MSNGVNTYRIVEESGTGYAKVGLIGTCPPLPTPTPTPTLTSTPAPLGCFTYSIQNNDLSQNLTFQYRDCDGNLISDQVVLADSGTPDFCAEEGSVSRQSGTFSWVLTTEATTCVEPTQTPTPTATATSIPATPTPTPTSTFVDPYNYYFIQHCEGEPLDRVVRTTQTFTVGNSSTGTYVSILGQGYVVVSGANKNEYDTNAGDESSYDLGSTSYPGIGCPVIPTPTPTPTSTPSTTCQYVFVPNTVSTTDRGLRYNNGGEVNTSFSSLFGVPSYEGGVNGVVYGVCTSTAPQWLIVSSNVTTTFPSGVYIIGSGGSCSDNTPDCEWTPTQPPVPTPTPTPTSTPPPLGCYTYSIQNNDFSQNLTFQYRDCDGNLISDQVVLADSGTPDFCAEEGSVSRQSGTFSWVLTTEATTCIEPTPTPTPSALPPTPTPTATSSTPTCPTETLGDGPTSNDACNDFTAGTGTVRYLDGPFPFATVIYRNPDCTGNAAAGYYSDGGVWRYWNGSIFTGLNGTCEVYGGSQ